MTDVDVLGRVVAGTDGSVGGDAAVRYAAAEAAMLGVGLAIVHVTPDHVPVAAMRPVVPDLAAIGATILSGAATAAVQAMPGVDVVTVLRTGQAVATLASLSNDARLVVLGHEAVPPLLRVFTGAVTVGVAARAHCPVVSVPDAWSSGTPSGLVVAGLKSSAHAPDLLARAFGEAALRGARLVVVHAWALPSMYDDAIVTRARSSEWSEAAARDVEPQLAAYRASHRQVDVEVQAVHGQGARVLLEASRGADLLVLVRRAYGLQPAAHLGPTSRALLRDASCPVEIVPPRRGTGSRP